MRIGEGKKRFLILACAVLAFSLAHKRRQEALFSPCLRWEPSLVHSYGENKKKEQFPRKQESFQGPPYVENKKKRAILPQELALPRASLRGKQEKKELLPRKQKPNQGRFYRENKKKRASSPQAPKPPRTNPNKPKDRMEKAKVVRGNLSSLNKNDKKKTHMGL